MSAPRPGSLIVQLMGVELDVVRSIGASSLIVIVGPGNR
jgi:hypothetical protein